MSTKDALINSAQKFLQKGLTERALTCYQEAVGLDPADQRLRQRLAELLAQCRRFDAARKELEIIGKSLTANGFFLKAIAVYKQIEKLFPDDISVTTTLASLHEKHGLTANALADYKRVFDHYNKLGNSGEVLRTLEAMRRVDPHNPAILLKFAEMQYQEGKSEAALDSFRALGGLLVDRGDSDGFIRLARHVIQRFPDAVDFAGSVVEQKIDEGAAERGLLVANALICQCPDDIVGWRMQLHVQRHLGKTAALQETAQECLSRFPEALFPREQLISSYLSEQNSQAALDLLDASESLFLSQGAAGTLLSLYQQLNEIAPINLRILNGCARAAQTAGADQEAALFRSKIEAMAGQEDGEAAAESDHLPDEPLDLLPEGETSVAPDSELQGDASGASLQESAAVAPLDEETQTFDLSADALYEIEVDVDIDFDAASNAASGWLATVTGLFDSIQADAGKVRFAEGMEQDDFRSQYDLGQAFYEMGLYDEAIQAFRQASYDSERRVSCLISIGACLRGKGALPLAENALRMLLDSSELSVENLCAVNYELALVCSALGNDVEAQEFLETIYQLDPHFRDVADRLQAATEDGEALFDFGDDDLSGFELK